MDQENNPPIKTAPSDGATPQGDIPAPTTTPPIAAMPPAPAEAPLTAAAKLEQARTAMEGPERAAKRQREEGEAKINREKTTLNKELAKINGAKEKLELAWVELDDRRGLLRKELEPILKEETAAEEEERKIEAEEETTLGPSERQLVEKKRWDIQDRRREIEKRKWALEERIATLEKGITDNTAQYQTWLDEEEKVSLELKELENKVL